ncbi:YitT family protein [Salinispira pacifica]|uniref:DUF2179 domain-containing protein n=1 Tax=Salinispira pacifica TaxID=1307761 RepID=V5WNT3_9SPIO|nr:YitT family protein [Salinispira pacifica]AHC16761.1 hypothetical protein L21SP2_3423 [Salinispira pacifica]
MKLNMQKTGPFIRQTIGIVVGSLIFGIALSWFLLPYKIAPGGVGGLSQIFFHLFGWNAGFVMMMMNIPLWILGIWLVGRQFGLGTFIGFFMSSAMTDLVSPRKLYEMGILTEMIERYNTVDGVMKASTEWAMTDDIFLAAIAGSMLLGVGLGLIFKSKASTGGTDVPVAIMKKYMGISIGNGYLIIETLIILIIGVVFANLNIIIWSYFGLYLSAKFTDMVTEGISRVKTATIICSGPEAEERIKNRIYNELDRGVTFLNGRGSWSGEEKNLIFVAFGIQQASTLKAIAHQEDPDVFMIMNDVRDVIGFGFKSREINLGD